MIMSFDRVRSVVSAGYLPSLFFQVTRTSCHRCTIRGICRQNSWFATAKSALRFPCIVYNVKPLELKVEAPESTMYFMSLYFRASLSSRKVISNDRPLSQVSGSEIKSCLRINESMRERREDVTT